MLLRHLFDEDLLGHADRLVFGYEVFDETPEFVGIFARDEDQPVGRSMKCRRLSSR